MALQILNFISKYALSTLDCPAAELLKRNAGEPQVKVKSRLDCMRI